VVGCDGAGNLLILLGGGDGTLTLSKYIADGCAWVTTADFNRDGNPDIAVGVSSTNADLTNNQVIVYLGDGKGGVSSQVVNSNVDFSETLEVADILRAHGDRFLDRYRSSFGFQQLKAFEPFSAAAPLTSAGIAMLACAAVIRLSRTTRAEIDTAPSVRPKPATAGCRPASAIDRLFRCLPTDLLRPKPPFKSHSTPRPPQTPAASS